MNSTTMRNIYFRLLLLVAWLGLTAVVAASIVHANGGPHSAYPLAKYGNVSP